MAHLQQNLKIELPEAVVDHLHYSTETVNAISGYAAGAAQVWGSDGSLLGVLAYFPSCSLKAVQGK
jgi:hypothetical protein